MGFEPTEAFTSHAFEACPFGRSGTLPGRKVSGIGESRHNADFPILKFSSGHAETSVVQVDLFDQGADTSPRPAWQVIEAARRRYLTGLLVLETTPPTHVYLRDGQVYFAERTTDGGLAVRLLVEGVITRAQMQKATLQVSGVEHLGRMFERDDSIDRDAVELCVELMTDDVLTQIAESPVSGWDLKMYHRHPSGLDRWLPTRVEVITHLVDSAAHADPEATPTTAPAPRARPQLSPPPVADDTPAAPERPAVAPEPVVVVAEAAPPAPVAPAPAFTVLSPTPPSIPVTLPPNDPTPIATPQPDLEFEPATAWTPMDLMPPEPAPPEPAPVEGLQAEQPTGPQVDHHVEEPVVAQAEHEPATDASDDEAAPVEEQPLAGLAPSAMEAMMSGSIKDEVAEAVRRALAAIDN